MGGRGGRALRLLLRRREPHYGARARGPAERMRGGGARSGKSLRWTFEINFAITKSGLEGQLLGVMLHHEQPELEMQQSAMLKQEDYKVELAGLEKNLLEALSTAEGDLLQNFALIGTSTTPMWEQAVFLDQSVENVNPT